MYSRQIENRTYSFGVSGLLYNSNVLMYDLQTESLWSQIRRQAVTGPLSGTRLEALPSTLTSWKKWKTRFPQTEVLSLDTGYRRDYSRDPYADYYQSRRGLFGLFKGGPGEEEKALVVGIEQGPLTAAYPLKLLRERRRIEEQRNGRRVVISYRAADDRIEVTLDGASVPNLVTYWFVWKGFYPQSDLYGEER